MGQTVIRLQSGGQLVRRNYLAHPRRVTREFDSLSHSPAFVNSGYVFRLDLGNILSVAWPPMDASAPGIIDAGAVIPGAASIK